jgi:hypothetical protein
VSDLYDITHSVPFKIEEDEVLPEQADAEFDFDFEAHIPALIPYDPWLSQRPFTANQMKAYIALMPVDHGKNVVGPICSTFYASVVNVFRV